MYTLKQISEKTKEKMKGVYGFYRPGEGVQYIKIEALDPENV